MTNDRLQGRPPKSSADIRRILKSIHDANVPRKPGPYVHGLPELERNSVLTSARRHKTETRRTAVSGDSTPRSPAYYHELLLRRGGFVGGFIGLLLGLNVGLALPIMMANLWLFALTPLVTSLCGCGIGLTTARVTIVDRRHDLFRSAPAS